MIRGGTIETRARHRRARNASCAGKNVERAAFQTTSDSFPTRSSLPEEAPGRLAVVALITRRAVKPEGRKKSSVACGESSPWCCGCHTRLQRRVAHFRRGLSEAPRVARTCATGEATFRRCRHHHSVAGCRRATDVCPKEARFIIAPFVSFIREAIGSRVAAGGCRRTPPRWSAVENGASCLERPRFRRRNWHLWPTRGNDQRLRSWRDIARDRLCSPCSFFSFG